MTPKYRMNRCAPTSGTPSRVIAGAAMAAKTIYFAVVGRPIPSMIEAIIVRNRVGSKTPPEAARIRSESLRPRPVKVITPVIMPQIAQATVTLIALKALFLRASTNPAGVSLVCVDRQEPTNRTAVETSAALSGLKPITIRTTITTRGISNGALLFNVGRKSGI